MAVVDLDPSYAKAITALHSTAPDSLSSLQTVLEDAIKVKSGSSKDLTSYLNRSYNTLEELSLVSSVFLDDVNKRSSAATSPIVSIGVDDSKTNSSSDNELELDLLKEDLMCIVCNGMDVGARNRLLECSECHSLYHQECHRPPVTDGYAGTWICLRCKESSKSSKKSVSVLKSSHSKSSSNRSSSPTYFSSKAVVGSSSKGASPVHNSSSSSKSSSNSSSSKQSPGSSSSSRQVTPNINIISADKRLQIMKKKAAKLQEKRKLHR